VNNPWYNEYSSNSIPSLSPDELRRRRWELDKRAADLQAAQTNALLRASGVPFGPDGQPQYQRFTPAQHSGFNRLFLPEVGV
jgi:hypothetical protein